jgi:hypothetical protein
MDTTQKDIEKNLRDHLRQRTEAATRSYWTGCLAAAATDGIVPGTHQGTEDAARTLGVSVPQMHGAIIKFAELRDGRDAEQRIEALEKARSKRMQADDRRMAEARAELAAATEKHAKLVQELASASSGAEHAIQEQRNKITRRHELLAEIEKAGCPPEVLQQWSTQ